MIAAAMLLSLSNAARWRLLLQERHLMAEGQLTAWGAFPDDGESEARPEPEATNFEPQYDREGRRTN